MLKELLVTALLVVPVSMAGNSAPQGPATPLAPACSALCKVTIGDSGSFVNPGGGTMTITYENLSPGICGCETLPCAQMDPCSGRVRIAFDDHVSWQTWVPDATINGTPTPICAQPAPGSNDPPDHTESVDACGKEVQIVITQWKARHDPTQTFDINPDITAKVACSSCKVNNCN